jgi:uncharacterized protein (TIGR03437 family)
VPYVGLAGGLLGIYQVDFSIPAQLPAGTQAFFCETADGFRDVGTLPIGAAGAR